MLIHSFDFNEISKLTGGQIQAIRFFRSYVILTCNTYLQLGHVTISAPILLGPLSFYDNSSMANAKSIISNQTITKDMNPGDIYSYDLDTTHTDQFKFLLAILTVSEQLQSW
jgi:hypothetical protein